MSANPVAVPRGVEVLVKKAAVDAEFKAVLMAKRAEAAKEIGLELDPAEAMMINAVAATQLDAIIARTTVSPMTRAAFLGKAAAVMLVALGADVAAVEGPPPPGGIAPDRPKHERYVIYSETNYKGEMSYAVAEDAEYEKKVAEAIQKNKVIRQAYAAAVKAWREDEAHKFVTFPMRAPQMFAINRVASYSSKERADEMLAKRQEILDRKNEDLKKAEERRLAAMTDQARAKEKEKADQLKAAEALLEKELATLLAAPKQPSPPVTRGVQPDVPPAATGIRP